ncbi:hypothetical protein G9A89_003200 [Geosiphon pyriformis]|nr:hypothetical protein G9A89_003200 [Geosiphon pyriformis]
MASSSRRSFFGIQQEITYQLGSNEQNAKSQNNLWLIMLCICVVAFVIQTEIAQQVQTQLHFDKPYFILWIAHSCYIIVLPFQFAFNISLDSYLKKLLSIGNELRTKVRASNHHLFLIDEEGFENQEEIDNDRPEPMFRELSLFSIYHTLLLPQHWLAVTYILKISLIFALFLCLPAYFWYIAVNLTSMANLTAIYNTGCFFAYLFSILILGEPVKGIKILAVALSIAGVALMSYWDVKHEGNDSATDKALVGENGSTSADLKNLFPHISVIGNIIACLAAAFSGLYEIIYKKYASPEIPSILFVNTVTGLIGICTFLFLWIPIPLLHLTGIEPFELPDLKTFGYILLIALSGIAFNASFMLVIAITSPLFASVGIMLTIPIVAVVDLLITRIPLKGSTIIGSLGILISFGLLTRANIQDNMVTKENNDDIE